jgi:hypothetical protein
MLAKSAVFVRVNGVPISSETLKPPKAAPPDPVNPYVPDAR